MRQVASKVRTLTALKKSYGPVVSHLESLAERTEGYTVSSEEAATAKGLLSVMKSERFVPMLHFLIDLLTIMTTLSLFFQQNDICISQIPDKIMAVRKSFS